MIIDFASFEMPVDEVLKMKKNRLQPIKTTGNEKRISIVTGIHGDELEGQYVCYELQRRIHENIENLHGIVDIYPAMNPLGIDSMTRGFPLFDLDMNRIFPGNKNGTMAEDIVASIVDDVKGSDLAMDIHASNIFLTEIPQIRINEITADTLVPIAKRANVDYVWVHQAATVLQETFAYSMNALGTPTLVVEMGVGLRITKKYGDQLVDGIFCLMKDLGIWDGDTIIPKDPIVSTDGNVHFINAASSGIFIPEIEHWKSIRKGELLGNIVDPLSGERLHKIYSPCNGIVFTLRDYPVVYEGSLIARILEREA